MQKKELQLPNTAVLESELRRERNRLLKSFAIRKVLNIILIIGIILFFVCSIKFGVIQIYDNAMEPVLENGQLLIVIKGEEIQQGDLVAISMGNTTVVKRVIGEPLDEVDIKKDGTVLLNKQELKEQYISKKMLGETDLSYPYQVPAYRYFVMGDHREASFDSRNSRFGCIAQEQIIGKAVICIWPLNKIGLME